MKLEVQWLAHLLIQEHILTKDNCRLLKSRLPNDIEAAEFGETLSDYNLCTDRELMQSLVEQAIEKSQLGRGPMANPFLREGEQPEPVASVAAAGEREERTESTKPKISLSTAGSEQAASKPNSNSVETRTPCTPAPRSRVETAPSPVRSAPAPAATAPTPATSEALSDAQPAFEPPAGSGMPRFGSPLASTEQARQVLVQALAACHQLGISDLHLSAGCRPFGRKDRGVEYLEEAPLSAENSRILNTCFLSPFKADALDRAHDLDYALSLGEQSRYRVNVMKHKEGYAGTYRVVAERIRNLQELGFDSTEHLEQLLDYHNGLILVTGPVGSGKSTTLAALVDHMNKHRRDHIICVEEPIEITHRSDQCQITQREVGSHTKSFQSALKGALRQDPDIIVIGEMRDLETIEMAISASETGHLVIGTMHTSDAATTLNRLMDVFPAAQQQQIRAMVSESLRGILCQRLLPGKDSGTELAMELLVSNVAVKNLIRECKTDGLPNVIETGVRQGMVLMDKSIMKLWQAGRISGSVARANLVSDMLKKQIPA